MRGQLQGLAALIAAIPAGPPGPQGPPFANALVDFVNTLNPGESATVTVSFDGTNVHFTIGIPRGADGSNGTNGTNGSDGAQGPPGEVTAQQLADAITAALASAASAAAANSSANTNAVPTLDTPFADPDTEALRQKVNEMLATMRR